MFKEEKENSFNFKKWGLIWGSILTVVFLILIIGGVIGFQKTYAQKFYPGVKIGYLDVAGQTKEQVLEQLKKIGENVRNKGLIFKDGDKEVTVNPIVISATDPDLSKPILIFNWEQTIEAAYQVGRGGNWSQNLFQQFKTLVFYKELPVVYNLDQEELMVILETSFSELEKPPANAQLVVTDDQIEVIGEQSGYIFDYQKAVDQAVININSLDFAPIALDLEFREPEIKKEHTGSAVNSLENILVVDSIKLTVGSNWWSLNKLQFVSWLEFQLIDDEIVVGLTREKVLEFLDPILEFVNVEAKDAKFKLEGKRVAEFQASQDGKTLNLEASYQKINSQIILGNSEDIELVVDVKKAKVATGDINDLGIKELIGRGASNFAGSPTNRRHNIAVGAATLNGILIAPGEEFSLIKTLGDIDGESGYKQELVIKGDRTIPEYGGGLCQIGTTTFRVALRSGLPITMRRNHSYRVVYYEPAGMDATIYNPYPDMKFLNDTDAHILFTTRIVGDELIFEFFGTKDGREVLIDPDPPSIFNITTPPEPRYIETDGLEPGVEKRVESAHRGADTYFKYTVTYPDGEVKETDFNSHYVAWPEVWLVGRISTSTNETVEELNN